MASAPVGTPSRSLGNRDSSPSTRFRPDRIPPLSFAPPFFQDSAASPSVSPARFSLAQTGSALTVSVSANPAWLTSASRVWPLVLDPSVTVNPSQNGTVGSGTFAIENLCPTPGSVVEAGYDGYYLFHGLVQFDLSAVPSRATVLDGALQLDL